MLVPLVEYDKPRILTVNFQEPCIKKLTEWGFSVKEAFTNRNGEFLIPCSDEDIEVILFNGSGNYSLDNVEPNEKSVYDSPCFSELIRTVWNRHGFVIVFFGQDFTPMDFYHLGIRGIGVYSTGDRTEYVNQSHPGNASFPKFIGQAVVIKKEDETAKILEPKLRSFDNLRILSVEKNIRIEGGHEVYCRDRVPMFREEWLIKDTKDRALTIWYENSIPESKKGGLLILPSLGSKNIDLSIELISKVFSVYNPDIFSGPQHIWLSNYPAYPIRRLEEEKRVAFGEHEQEIEAIEKKIASSREEFSWMDSLLVGEGDGLVKAVSDALTFLGFKVTSIDDRLEGSERKREDLHIEDASDFFAIGEVKSTSRGASEDFISAVNRHQIQFSRDKNVPAPRALLFINHSKNMDPISRKGRFYSDTKIYRRCEELGIIPIDTVSLHRLCNKVLAGEEDNQAIKDQIKSAPVT